MDKKKPIRRAVVIAALFLLLCYASSAYLAYRTSEYIFDSDASSELVLAEQLSKEGGILSENWYYSTELRVLNTQLVFVPLFHLFDSWRTIRWVGAAVMQAILVLSFLFSARQAGIRWPIALVGGGSLLLPLSTSYARIVLMHCYYIPHISIGFFALGLFFKLMRTEKKKIALLLYAAFLLLAFGSGLGGVRQLMVTFLPMLAVAAVLFAARAVSIESRMLQQKERVEVTKFIAEIRKRQVWRGLLAVLSGCFVNGVAFLINTELLAKRYPFENFDEKGLWMPTVEKIGEALEQIFALAGFRSGTRAVSPAGIAVCLSIFFLVCCVCIGILLVRKSLTCGTEREETADASYVFSFAGLFFPVGFAVNAGIIILTGMLKELYWIPILAFSALMLCAYAETAARNGRLLQQLLAAGLVGVCVLNAWQVEDYFIAKHCGEEPIVSGSISFDGLDFTDIDHVRTLQSAVNSLEQAGLTYGYASFWNANVCTEMTDGALRLRPINIAGDGLSEQLWLCTKQDAAWTEAGENQFLLLSVEEQAQLLPLLSEKVQRGSLQLLTEDEDFCVYVGAVSGQLLQ